MKNTDCSWRKDDIRREWNGEREREKKRRAFKDSANPQGVYAFFLFLAPFPRREATTEIEPRGACMSLDTNERPLESRLSRECVDAFTVHHIQTTCKHSCPMTLVALTAFSMYLFEFLHVVQTGGSAPFRIHLNKTHT